MHMITTSIEKEGEYKVSDKKLLVLYEIGLNLIPTATDFVDYLSAKHGISASGIWYTLKKLKKEGLVDFTERGEGQKPLGLTGVGMHIIRSRPARETSLAELHRHRNPDILTLMPRHGFAMR